MAHDTRKHINVCEIPANELNRKIKWLVRELTPGNPLVCAAAIVATSDIRSGEALALTWGDVDLETKSAYIHRTSTYYGVTRPAKTVRTVHFGEDCAQVLERLLENSSVGGTRRKDARPMADELVVHLGGDRVSEKLLACWWKERNFCYGMDSWTLSDLRKAGKIVAHYAAEAGC